jgi:hypothetical protein
MVAAEAYPGMKDEFHPPVRHDRVGHADAVALEEPVALDDRGMARCGPVLRISHEVA